MITFTSLYNIGDTVYTIGNGKIIRGTIEKIQFPIITNSNIEVSSYRIQYCLLEESTLTPIWRTDDQIASSAIKLLEDMIESLKKN